MLQVRIKDVGKNFLTHETKYFQDLQEADTKHLAEVTADIIKNTIQSKAKHPTGNLASGFFAEKITGGWGVGDIDTLNQVLKYWRHVNYGSEAIGANWQHWLPKGRWVDGRWVASEDGYWFMPSRPIQPLNYIEDTLSAIEAQIDVLLAEKKI
jgi:hypothetical protein